MLLTAAILLLVRSIMCIDIQRIWLAGMMGPKAQSPQFINMLDTHTAAQKMRFFALADAWNDAFALHDQPTLSGKQRDTRILLTAQIAAVQEVPGLIFKLPFHCGLCSAHDGSHAIVQTATLLLPTWICLKGLLAALAAKPGTFAM